MTAAAMCREMGWTYNEYLEQPMPFLWALGSMLKAEAEDRKRRNA
jgi:hypothetical protein